VAGDSPDVRIRLLGPLEVVSGGSSLDLGGRRQRQLLALLAINLNQVVSLDRIVDELWGESPPARVEASVHSYISNLRRVLEPDRAPRSRSRLLPGRPPGYMLSVAHDRIDSFEFERLVEEGRRVVETDPVRANLLLRRALDLWRGSALEDFVYEQFAVAEAERLNELRVEAIEFRMATDLAMGRSAGLVAEAEHLVEANPLRERLWHHLMVALYRSGRQAEALRAYQRFASRLGEELGIEPSPELRELEERILQQDPDLYQAQTAAAVGLQTATPPLIVGREKELEVFRQAVARAKTGTGSLILVEGEPGIGKTCLLEAIDSDARHQGIPSAVARCVEVGGSPPYWPWSQVFRGLVGVLGVDTVTASADPYPNLVDGPPTVQVAWESAPSSLHTADASVHQVAEGVIHSLTGLSTSQPLVILIDDLYSADPDSLSVLVLLAAELSRLGIVVAGSYRTTDVPPEHPLAHALADLARLDVAQRLRLDELNLEETRSIVKRIAGERVPADTAEVIWSRSEGNPFFAVELTRLLTDEDPATTSDLVVGAVPSTVRDVINQRLLRLGDPVNRFLGVASVAGRRWDLPLLVAITDVDLETAVDMVENAVTAGFIEEEAGPGRYRFTHVLIGETIATGLGSLRRAQIHRRIADYLELEWGADSSYWADIAHHALGAVSLTGPESAVSAVARAGLHALESRAYELSEQLLTQRLDLVERMSPGDERDRAEVKALLDLCRVWMTRGAGFASSQMAAASDRLLQLAKGARGETVENESSPFGSVVLPALRARFVQEMVEGQITDAAQTVAKLDELAAVAPDPLVAIAAHIDAVLWADHAGAVQEALQRTDLALGLLRQLEPDESGQLTLPPSNQSMAVTSYINGSWANALAGRTSDAREMLERAKKIATRLEDPFSIGLIASQGILVAHMLGDWALLTELIDWGRRSVTSEFVLYHAIFTAASTVAAAIHGDNQALEKMEEAVLQMETMGVGGRQTQWYGMFAEVYIARGRIKEALEAVREGLNWSREHGERYWVPELERQAGLALAAKGDVAESAAAFDRARAIADEMGNVLAIRRLGNPDSRSGVHPSTV
jgi:DNA-binding SARP family transcriptional activator